MDNKYSTILEKIKEVPPLSHSALKLIDLMNDENHSIKEVIEIIEKDSILTANILKTINSASFGLRSQIESISRAAAYLGDKTIVGMAIGSCATKIYDRELEGYATEKGELWKYSLKTAIAARYLAEFSMVKVPKEVAYTAGILHDIGKSILSDFIADYKEELIKKLQEQEIKDFQKIEQEVLGIDHCQTGFEIARHWKLPELYCQTILHYHHPENAPDEFKPLIYIVHLASVLAMLTGSGTRLDSFQYSMADDFDQHIKITEDQLESITVDVGDDFDKVADSMTF